MWRPNVIAVILLLITACESDSGPTVVIDDVQILGAVPGSTTGVAYLTISNSGDVPITVQSARSPQFDRVEIHQTTVEDGVARMRPVADIRILPGESVRFEAGGRHLMLMGPRPGTTPGTPVTIELSLGDGLLIVSATLQDRLPTE